MHRRWHWELCIEGVKIEYPAGSENPVEVCRLHAHPCADDPCTEPCAQLMSEARKAFPDVKMRGPSLQAPCLL